MGESPDLAEWASTSHFKAPLEGIGWTPSTMTVARSADSRRPASPEALKEFAAKCDAVIHAGIRAFVMITVTRALPVISPGYVGDVTEAQMRAQWEEYYASVNARFA